MRSGKHKKKQGGGRMRRRRGRIGRREIRRKQRKEEVKGRRMEWLVGLRETSCAMDRNQDLRKERTVSSTVCRYRGEMSRMSRSRRMMWEWPSSWRRLVSSSTTRIEGSIAPATRNLSTREYVS